VIRRSSCSGEDMNFALTNVTAGFLSDSGRSASWRCADGARLHQLRHRCGDGWSAAGDRVPDPVLVVAGVRAVTNQANKFRLMSGGQTSVPVDVPDACCRVADGVGAQHSDQPYSMLPIWA